MKNIASLIIYTILRPIPYNQLWHKPDNIRFLWFPLYLVSTVTKLSQWNDRFWRLRPVRTCRYSLDQVSTITPDDPKACTARGLN